jgi:predicted glycosyl hydrolase (DUF1957 family)
MPKSAQYHKDRADNVLFTSNNIWVFLFAREASQRVWRSFSWTRCLAQIYQTVKETCQGI